MKKPGMRKIVETGYDEGDYARHFRSGRELDEREVRLFNKLTENIPQGGRILDLGSGTGIPYDRHLVNNGYDITGYDILSESCERVFSDACEKGTWKIINESKYSKYIR